MKSAPLRSGPSAVQMAITTAAIPQTRARAKHEGRKKEWTELRDRREYAHVARAVLASVSLLALVVSLVVQP